MNDRQLPASSRCNGRATWVRVLVVGVLVVAGGRAEAVRTQGLQPVTVTADPIAPLVADPTVPTDASKTLDGHGLCAAYRTTTNPSAYFPGRNVMYYPGSVATGTEPFEASVNAFMDGTTGAGDSMTAAAYQTMQTPFDLAAFNIGPNAVVDGDFILTPGCSPNKAGCPFPASGGTSGVASNFGSRYRGFLQVTTAMTNQKLHFGFTVDSGMTMLVYPKLPRTDGGTGPYVLLSRAAEVGQNSFRITNQITFTKAGLYAIEILHASANKSARLEMAIYSGEFDDIDEQATDTDMAKALPARPGTPFLLAQAKQFYQRVDGADSFPGQTDKCQQCPRKFAGTDTKPVKNSCPECMTCNEAALCQICDGDNYCGCTCTDCSKTADPYCTGTPGDLSSYRCVQCVTDAQCPSGQNCINNVCIGFCPCCDSPKSCITYAGDADADPVVDKNKLSAKYCSECAADADCPNGKCDKINARCVDSIPDHNTDKDCGLNAVNCITTTANDHTPRPFCLNAEVCVQCRFDFDCDRGNYCRSGDCIPCTDDRHCGPQCGSCGVSFAFDGGGAMTGSSMTNTPVCYAPAAPNDHDPAPTPICVECLADAHCGTGGACDLSTHKCTTKIDCPGGCPVDQVCNGGVCVGCVTSSQCRCGTCTAGVCTPSCGDSSDCMSNQCCAQETSSCVSGRCKPGLTAHGGALCCEATAGAVGGGEDPGAPVRSRAALWSMLMALGMLAALRLRALRATRLASWPGRRGSRE